MLFQIYKNQLEHVRKGCLARQHQDICTDGSRIESSHKSWNDIARTHPCGLVLFIACAHDFVLRRNIRIAYKLKKPVFLTATFGCHYIALCDRVARRWNVVSRRAHEVLANHPLLPVALKLLEVQSKERLGLVNSAHTDTFGGLFEMKEEDVDVQVPGSSIEVTEDDQTEELLKTMKLDPSLTRMPLQPRAESSNAAQQGAKNRLALPVDATRDTATAALTVSLHASLSASPADMPSPIKAAAKPTNAPNAGGSTITAANIIVSVLTGGYS